MKRCSKCGLNYKDNSLDFCLEDGTRLVSVTNFDTEIPTITNINNPRPTMEKTVSFPSPTQASGLPLNKTNDNARPVPQSTLIKEKAIEQSNRILETAPVVIALAHNWWQWIYLNNQSYSTFTGYVFSANFLIWLLLLTAGTILGLLSFKRIRNKGFAITGLVILAINFILFMVPRR